jgi:hypothetical protein
VLQQAGGREQGLPDWKIRQAIAPSKIGAPAAQVVRWEEGNFMSITQHRHLEDRDHQPQAVSCGPLHRSLIVIAGLVFIASLAVPAFAQRDLYRNARALVGQTQTDLRNATEMSQRHDRELQRVDYAQKHLSEFDRALSKRKWDKGKLDAAIDDLQNVIDHNTLEPEDRDRLSVDLRDLRGLRIDRDR